MSLKEKIRTFGRPAAKKVETTFNEWINEFSIIPFMAWYSDQNAALMLK